MVTRRTALKSAVAAAVATQPTLRATAGASPEPSPTEPTLPTTEHTTVHLVTLDAPETTAPPTQEITALLRAAGQPVNQVRVLQQHYPWSAVQVLESEIGNHLQSYIAPAWSAYKRHLHTVTAAGGVDGAPVPFHVTSPLCRLDEEAVAMVCDTWREGFKLGMSLARALASGGVAVRLPEVVLCPRCHGDQVTESTPPSLDDPDCPVCGGEGVVDEVPDLLVLAGTFVTLPLPLQIIRT